MVTESIIGRIREFRVDLRGWNWREQTGFFPDPYRPNWFYKATQLDRIFERLANE